MAWAPATKALRDRLESLVTYPPLAFENEKFTKPGNSRPWALVRFIGGGNDWKATGGPDSAFYGHDGLMHVLIHVPKNSGMAWAEEKADAIAALFRNEDIPAPAAPDYVRCLVPRVDHNVAIDTENVYEVILLSVPFTFHHFR